MENQKKENIVTKYLKHPGMWISALLGRPTPVNIPEGQVIHQDTQNQATPPSDSQSQPVRQTGTQASTRQVYAEDPVAHDLAKAKNIFSKITAKAQTLAKPVVEKGLETSAQAKSASNQFVKTDKFKKILPIIIFVFVLLILAVVGISLFRSMGKRQEPNVVAQATPTPAEYLPSIPSIYANDPEVLKLEENIIVLDREIAGTQLREPTLNPPILDFAISF